jgi:hypothetical protein
MRLAAVSHGTTGIRATQAGCRILCFCGVGKYKYLLNEFVSVDCTRWCSIEKLKKSDASAREEKDSEIHFMRTSHCEREGESD